MNRIIKRRYSELIRFDTFEDRFEYLSLNGSVGIETFGFERYLNQALYRSPDWKKVRQQVIIRDNGCDLADADHPIGGRIIIHHMNPITEEMISNRDPEIFDLENLICVSIDTHNAIHYSNASILPKPMIERRENDTKLW